MSFERKGENIGGKVGHEMDKKANEMGTSFDKMKDGAQDMINNVKDKASNVASSVQDQACEYVDKVSGKVKDEPMKSLMWAALAGLVVGMLLKS